MSMQTYGQMDGGICIPAEVGIMEWSLALGIMDEYHAIIGPWEIENEILRERATLSAAQSHQIPLEGIDSPEFNSNSRRTFLRVSFWTVKFFTPVIKSWALCRKGTSPLFFVFKFFTVE